MFHVLEALVRWIAPILSYTADEIWQHLPAVHKRPESVFLATWYDDLVPLDSDAAFNHDFWQTVMDVRNAVSKELEKSRAAGVIGASLTAEVALYCEANLLSTLKQLSDELRFVFITSGTTVLKLDDAPTDAVASELEGLKIKIFASDKPKCVRCWHQREDVGSHAEHPELCGRCVENIALTGEGEVRRYA